LAVSAKARALARLLEDRIDAKPDDREMHGVEFG
jgi:hypothetical protein